jgi:predicted alpha/beta hydrolase family esterase
MPRRPTRTVPTVVIPGIGGSGPDHWQTWLEEQLQAAGRQTLRPEFADLDHAVLSEWLSALRATLADLPADGFDVVAHSLGAAVWLHHVDDPGDSPRAARVLLVAPPAPDLDVEEAPGFLPPPMDVDAVRRGADGTVLVAGEADPYLPDGIGMAYGRPLRMAATVIPNGGHLNAESGYGEWPAVLDWCGRDNLAFIG